MKFAIGNQFLIDPIIDQLFVNVNALSKHKTEKVTFYTGNSVLFDRVKNEKGAKSLEAVFGYNPETNEFKAFDPGESKKGYLLLCNPDGNFGLKLEKKETKLPVKATGKLEDMLYNDLFKEAKKYGFKTAEHKDRQGKTLISYIKTMTQKINPPPKDITAKVLSSTIDDSSSKDSGIKTFKVIKEDSVTNASGFLKVGAIINESQEFPLSIQEMLDTDLIEEFTE